MKHRIAYAHYNNPAAYPPLIHSAQILAGAGWDVLVMGIEDEATLALDWTPHARITLKRLPQVTLGWRRTFYFAYFCVWVIWNTLRWRAQWLYASDLYAAVAALGVSLLSSVRVIYHEHDAPHVTTRFARFCVVMRNRLVQRADMCILPNRARAERFAMEQNAQGKTRIVWNCPGRAEVLPPAVGKEGALRLLYHGSLVPARLPMTVAEALAELPPTVCLRIIGYETVGHAGYMSRFLERAHALGVADRVEWLGAMARREMMARVRECDIGLALLPLHSDDWNEQTMVGASNKPFDYMACGLGLIVPDLPEWRACFVEERFARSCDPGNASSIAGAVRYYLDHPQERAARQERARAKIENEWNYETQFAPILGEMERM